MLIGANGDRALEAGDGGLDGTFVDAGDAVAVVPEAGDPNACTATQKRCNGACVPKSEPKYGCASADCSPCSVPNDSKPEELRRLGQALGAFQS